MSLAQKYLRNTTWLFAGRSFKMALGFIASAIVARHLGPDNFGIISYCYSLIAITMVLVSVGIEAIIVREVVKHPTQQSEILGSSIIIQYFSASASFLLLLLSTYILNLDHETTTLVLIAAISLAFKPLCILRNLFEAKVDAKTIAFSELIQTVLSFVFRIALVILKAPLEWFAFCLSLEWIASGIILLHFYRRKYTATGKLFSFSAKCSKRMLSLSWPLLISAVTIVLHQQIDRVMMRDLLGADANNQIGIYSAAGLISSMVVFLPQIIVSSLTPYLVEAHHKSADLYKSRVAIFMDLINGSSMLIALGVTMLAQQIILFAYGPSYQASAIVLQILAWKGFLVATGMATGRQSTVENLQRYGYWRNFIGICINIPVNCLLIPSHGAIGAALSTVISMLFANFVSHAIIKPYRHIFLIQLKSICAAWYRLPLMVLNQARH